jgi:hypothetical protein
MVRELPIVAANSVAQLFFPEMSNAAGKKRIPWTKLQTNPREFIKPKYLPKNVMLRQYHHLHRDEVDALLKHWVRRQAAGKVPLCFREKVKDDLQDERILEENDPDADMGPGGEAEKDIQDGDDSQVQEDGALQADSHSNAAENPSRVCLMLNMAIENANFPSLVAFATLSCQ